MSGLDWFPTLLAAAGDTAVKDRLLKGWAPKAGGTSFKVHLDGYNQLDFLTGKSPKSARDEFFYFNDDGDLVAMRWGNWKIVFEEQRAPGNMLTSGQTRSRPCACPSSSTSAWIPYEHADISRTSTTTGWPSNAYMVGLAQMKAAAFLETFVEYPPSQRPASFSIDGIRRKVDKKIDESFKKRGLE